MSCNLVVLCRPYIYIYLVYICVCKVQAKVDKEHMNKVEAVAYKNFVLK